MVRRTLTLILGFLLFFALSFCSLPKAYAEISAAISPENICQDTGKYTITIASNTKDFNKTTTYSYVVWGPGQSKSNPAAKGSGVITERQNSDPTQPPIQEFKIEMDTNSNYLANNPMGKALGTWNYMLWRGGNPENVPSENSSLVFYSDTYTMLPIDACTIGLPVLEMFSPVQMGTKTEITVQNINPTAVYEIWFTYGQEFLPGTTFSSGGWTVSADPDSKSGFKATRAVTLDADKFGSKTLCLKHGTRLIDCEVKISIDITQLSVPAGEAELVKSGDPSGSLDDYTAPDAPTPTNAPLPCAEGQRQQGKCLAVSTAIGNISTDPAKFTQFIYGIVLGLSGGIALIMIIISGYKFMVSQGNPEAIKAATEGLTSAAIGLLFIIFAFVILQIVGVDILRIPGFK